VCYTIIHSCYSFLLLHKVSVCICQFLLFPDSFNLCFLVSQTLFWCFCFMCFPVECFICHPSHIVSDTIFHVLQFHRYYLLLGTFFVTWVGQCTKLPTCLSVLIYKCYASMKFLPCHAYSLT